MTYKIGSKGSVVKSIQTLLGLTADGIFGEKTEAAVKEWQKKNGLDADGIVGPATYALMFPSKKKTTTVKKTDIIVEETKTEAPKKVDSRCVDASVIYDPLSVHVTPYKNRTIKYIAIHYTAGGSSAAGRAKGCKSTFEKRQASADFAVDDKYMVQFNPDLTNYYCWSVGDKRNPYTKGGAKFNNVAFNRNSVSIEICSNLKKGASASAANHEGWYYTDATIENALKLTKILMKKFNIDANHVVRHYDITGKVCPGIIGWNNELIYNTDGTKTTKYSDSSKWLEFKSKL